MSWPSWILRIALGACIARGAGAQAAPGPMDSVRSALPPRRIEAPRLPGAVQAAPPVVAHLLTTGAKSEVVQLRGTTANLAEKSARQLLAEVPGIHVYDMDGAGNQVNVSARGLDPHRSWEFNVRQNGVLTTSDQYGYPASHYSPPMEAIERIELVRGTAALQYGSQFGGMLNYVTKGPDTTRALALESRTTVGTAGLLSQYVAAGGRVGRVSYHAYGLLRGADGMRRTAQSRADAEFVSLSVPFGRAFSLRAEVGRSYYRYRMPGPLTDAQFASDAAAATRTRDWYSPDITVPSLTLRWAPRPGTVVHVTASAVRGTRSSVAVGGFATQPDTPSTAGLWSPRQVDIDRYDSRQLEVRWLQGVALGGREATLAVGAALTDNDLWRRQRGPGTRANDFDLSVTGAFARDIHYLTANVAAYAEAVLPLTSAWSVVPGVRVERGLTRLRGTLAYYDPADTPRDVRHAFPLFGLRSSLRLGPDAEWYGGWSQAYRPMILKDVLPEAPTERTDARLADAEGWTIESGVRGAWWDGWSYDVAAYLQHYANRFGMLALTDSLGAPYVFKTNVGTTRTAGVEARLAGPVGELAGAQWRLFGATALMDARYVGGSVVLSGVNTPVAGHRVESAPALIARGGLTATLPRGSATVQVSHVSGTYADALNTVVPSASGAVGRVPAYTVVDLHGGFALTREIRLDASVSNLFDAAYFTKRPQMYPGPGVWPSDGRTLQLSVSVAPGAR